MPSFHSSGFTRRAFIKCEIEALHWLLEIIRHCNTLLGGIGSEDLCDSPVCISDILECRCHVIGICGKFPSHADRNSSDFFKALTSQDGCKIFLNWHSCSENSLAVLHGWKKTWLPSTENKYKCFVFWSFGFHWFTSVFHAWPWKRGSVVITWQDSKWQSELHSRNGMFSCDEFLCTIPSRIPQLRKYLLLPIYALLTFCNNRYEKWKTTVFGRHNR